MIGAPVKPGGLTNPLRPLGGKQTVGSILGNMHQGGKVPEDGVYELKKDEEVTPPSKKKNPTPAGRNSKYRKVYLDRKKK
jgi:hypothetical protein